MIFTHIFATLVTKKQRFQKRLRGKTNPRFLVFQWIPNPKQQFYRVVIKLLQFLMNVKMFLLPKTVKTESPCKLYKLCTIQVICLNLIFYTLANTKYVYVTHFTIGSEQNTFFPYLATMSIPQLNVQPEVVNLVILVYTRDTINSANLNFYF